MSLYMVSSCKKRRRMDLPYGIYQLQNVFSEPYFRMRCRNQRYIGLPRFVYGRFDMSTDDSSQQMFLKARERTRHELQEVDSVKQFLLRGRIFKRGAWIVTIQDRLHSSLQGEDWLR